MDFDSWYASSYSTVVSAVTIATFGDRRYVEDAVHDAYVQALERWDEVSAMASPVGWTVKVAINRARRRFRLSNRTSRLAADESGAIAVQDLFVADQSLWDAVAELPE